MPRSNPHNRGPKLSKDYSIESTLELNHHQPYNTREYRESHKRHYTNDTMNSNFSNDLYVIDHHEGYRNQGYSETSFNNLHEIESTGNNFETIKNFDEDDENERGNWGNKADYLMASLGYAVGLGNIWRFPYLCYRNGGGAFLIPYVIFLLFVGLPIFFLESVIGQYTSRGPSMCWEMSPAFRGIGVAMVLCTSMLLIYYNVIVGWALYYFGLSFNKVLPWSGCDPSWATTSCKENYTRAALLFNCSDSFIYKEVDGICRFNNNDSIVGYTNLTALFKFDRPTYPSEDFFKSSVLKMDDTPDEMHKLKGLVPLVAVALLAAWVLVFLAMIKGIKAAGKLIWFTALFPYLVLLILGIRGWLLDGAGDGIKYFIDPKVEKLTSPAIWNDAAGQIFFSLSTCFGGLIALSSYNKFNNNMMKDAFIVSFSNCLTSIFAGFVLFAYIGHLSFLADIPIEHVVADGPGLAFIVYPFAVLQIQPPQLWSAIFFFMVILLGLDSVFALLETVVTSIKDLFNIPKKRMPFVIAGCCTFYFLCGLFLTTRTGLYVFEILNDASGGIGTLTIGVFEVVAVIWVYGWSNLKADIVLMLGKGYDTFWMHCWHIIWRFFSPGVIIGTLAFRFYSLPSLKVNDLELPDWALYVSYTLSGLIILPIVLGIFIRVITYMKRNGFSFRSFREAFQYTEKWGPAHTGNRDKAYHLPNIVPAIDS
ncbi:hypothetical protein SNEBB_010953 [Seison nebaliae]|nr:hypothetical protein SNEBB_010953 [Seison nebaliae]